MKIFERDGYLVVGSESIYPINLVNFEIEADRLSIISEVVEEDGLPYRILHKFSIKKIEDSEGNSFQSELELQSYIDDISNNVNRFNQIWNLTEW